MNDFLVEIAGLTKSFRGQTALSGLDVKVPAGSIFGFLGRNGAGKTTTIKLLLGILKPDAGRATIFGLPVSDLRASIEIRRRIGFVSEEKELYPYMTVDQIIRFTRPFFPAWRDDLEQRYLKLFELPLKRKIADLSKGMRSKLMLLLAMSHGAELLILDEPSDGLDPAAVEDVLRELVALSASEGVTIFFSSHQLSEVEQVADYVSIIDHGKAIVGESLDDLKARYRRLHIVFENEPRTPIRWAPGAEHVRQEGRSVSILASRNVEELVEQARSIPGASVEQFPVNLREIFLEHVRGN
ncbi:MAG: ABC transporter ATP-binding protein [Acidobacteriaceae bacterium]|nr:ABC transporter ATP-binding protein [Acidobacteriaceae bacterium]